ncbi:MAG TPA: glycosyltransferase, partial [Deltaproteobacteria bacterium]|nr:glycosyltransferase [Deltaproteobacteria bacterium]
MSSIGRDARVLRQVKYLSGRYDLSVIGYEPGPNLPGARHSIHWKPVLNLPDPHQPNLAAALRAGEWKNLRIRQRTVNALYLFFPALHPFWFRGQPHYRQAWELTENTVCDAYHANDWVTLPLAARAAAKNKAALVLDLHEYAPLQYEHRPGWWIQKRLVTHVLRRYAPHVDASITVCEPIAKRYRDEFGLDPVVIMNCPEPAAVAPHATDPRNIRLVHHGIASPARHPEIMIETIALCDPRYSLHLMFLENDYVPELKRLAHRKAPGRVFFHDPVPPEDITQTIARFDVGFFPIPPVNYNYHACLPNKFFEFVCAGLAVAIGPSPAMAELVTRHGFGVISPSFDP